MSGDDDAFLRGALLTLPAMGPSLVQITRAGSFFCLPFADGGVELALHADVDVLQIQKAAAAIAGGAQAVEVAWVAGADELERGRLALAAIAAEAQLVDGRLFVVARGRLALLHHQRRAAELDRRLGRFF